MKAFLILEDGTVFEGTSIGSTREVISEIVFNTSMTGYLEVLTDPSYAGQAEGGLLQRAADQTHRGYVHQLQKPLHLPAGRRSQVHRTPGHPGFQRLCTVRSRTDHRVRSHQRSGESQVKI